MDSWSLQNNKTVIIKSTIDEPRIHDIIVVEMRNIKYQEFGLQKSWKCSKPYSLKIKMLDQEILVKLLYKYKCIHKYIHTDTNTNSPQMGKGITVARAVVPKIIISVLSLFFL